MGKSAMEVTRTHFVYRIDLWDSNGDNIVEHLAGVEDFQIAMDTYRSAVRRWPGGVITLRQGGGVIKDSGQTRLASWADKGREGARYSEWRGKKIPELLNERIAVVTGGGSGIGRAIALGYAKEGAHVAVLDVNGDAATETAKAITGAGGKAGSFVLDVTERDRCRDVAARIGAQVGQVSILVNNAGINRRNAFTADAEAVIKDWQDIMAVNLHGMFNVTHAFLGQLRATRGRIINIGSIQSFVHVRTPIIIRSLIASLRHRITIR